MEFNLTNASSSSDGISTTITNVLYTYTQHVPCVCPPVLFCITLERTLLFVNTTQAHVHLYYCLLRHVLHVHTHTNTTYIYGTILCHPYQLTHIENCQLVDKRNSYHQINMFVEFLQTKHMMIMFHAQCASTTRESVVISMLLSPSSSWSSPAPRTINKPFAQFHYFVLFIFAFERD